MKVIYHNDCQDGFMSAYLIHLAYGKFMKIDFYPMRYGQALPEIEFKHEDVWIVDFSLPTAELKNILNKGAAKITMLDHHMTALDNFEPIEGVVCVFDMSKCGARLTFEQLLFKQLHDGLFTKNSQKLYKIENFINIVQDRDLWEWNLFNSREITTAIASYPMDFDVWDKIIDPSKLEELVNQGSAIVRYQNQLVEQAVATASLIKLKTGHQIMSVSSPILASEIGSEIAQKYGMGMVWFINEKGVRKNSLRSIKGGDVDVSKIALAYGGGGHPSAASFLGNI